MKYRYALFLFLASLQVSAQVSGYMGKRLIVGYSNYLFPALVGPGPNATSPGTSFGLNTTHSFNLEFVTRSRTVFCASFQRSTTGMSPAEMSEDVYDGISSYTTYSYEYNPRSYKPMQINSNNIGLGFKFFQSGTLAPIGKYKKVELLVMLNKLNYDASGFEYYDYDLNKFMYRKIGTGVYNVNTFAVTYTMGRSRVLFDRLVVDYGLRIGVVPGGVWSVINENGDFFSTTAYNSYPATLNAERSLSNDTKRRLFRSQLLNFHLGFSLLAI